MIESKVVKIVTNTLGKFKEEILGAVRPPVREVFTLQSNEPMLTSGQGPPPRSNIWCGKCHGYGHLATECPTTSRIVPDQPRSLFCTYCLQNNHTEDACFIKKTHERRKAQGLQTNYNFLDQTNTSYEIGPPPRPFIQRGIPEPYM